METTKKCPRCELELPLQSFDFRDTEQKKIQSYCRYCAKQAWRAWYQVPENKQHHLAQLHVRRRRRIDANRELVRALKTSPCADCGGRFPPEVMDFDHLHDKEHLISKLVYQSGRDRLLKELVKCEVVCSNCHRLRTRSRSRTT